MSSEPSFISSTCSQTYNTFRKLNRGRYNNKDLIAAWSHYKIECKLEKQKLLKESIPTSCSEYNALVGVLFCLRVYESDPTPLMRRAYGHEDMPIRHFVRYLRVYPSSEELDAVLTGWKVIAGRAGRSLDLDSVEVQSLRITPHFAMQYAMEAFLGRYPGSQAYPVTEFINKSGKKYKT
jgi:hypothetical protein